MNSSPASSQISRSSSIGVGADAGRDLLEPRGVELDARLLGLAQDVDERQLDVVSAGPSSPRSCELRRAGARRARGSSTARAACSSSASTADAALLGQLVERVAAAGRVEQVGGDLGVEDEVGRDVAERLGVVGDHGAVAGGGDELGRVVDLARERVRAARVGAEAPARLARDQLALGDLGRERRRARARRPSAARRRAGPPCGPATVRASAASGRGIASTRRRRAPPRAGAAGRAAPSRGRPCAGCARSGVAGELGLEVEVDRDVADHRRELLGHARVVGVLGQVLLALGAGDLVDAGEHAPRGRRSAAAARRRSCRRCPGRRGCCRDVSPLRPMKSGTSSGGMP